MRMFDLQRAVASLKPRRLQIPPGVELSNADMIKILRPLWDRKMKEIK